MSRPGNPLQTSQHENSTWETRESKGKILKLLTSPVSWVHIQNGRVQTGRQRSELRRCLVDAEGHTPPFQWPPRPTVVRFWIPPITLHSFPWDCLLHPTPVRSIQIAMLFFAYAVLSAFFPHTHNTSYVETKCRCHFLQ